jgi:hypothetical protein
MHAARDAARFTARCDDCGSGAVARGQGCVVLGGGCAAAVMRCTHLRDGELRASVTVWGRGGGGMLGVPRSARVAGPTHCNARTSAASAGGGQAWAARIPTRCATGQALPCIRLICAVYEACLAPRSPPPSSSSSCPAPTLAQMLPATTSRVVLPQRTVASGSDRAAARPRSRRGEQGANRRPTGLARCLAHG